MPLTLIAGSFGLAVVPWIPWLIPLGYPYWALLSALLVLLISARFGTLLTCFLLGFIYSNHTAHNVNQALLAPQFEAKTTTITGRISGLPKEHFLYGKKQQSFLFELSEPLCFNGDCQPALTTIKVSWRHETELIPGQVWRLTVKLKRPRGLSNPAGFDYERWLITQGVHATATVKTNATHQHQLITVKRGLDTWRWSIAKTLDKRLKSLEYLPLIKALLLGDKRGIDQRLWQLFSASGTTHLVVVSGLHIGIVAFLSFQLARLLSSTLSYRSTNLIASVVSCSSTVLYSFLAGLSLPTQRAMIMVVLVVLLNQFARQYRTSTLLLMVVMACIVLDPMLVLGSSFWLSFGAVTAILLVSTGRAQAPKTWVKTGWLSTQLAVFVGLTPFLLLIFFKAPLLSIVINCLAVPFFSLLLIPLLCLAALVELLSGLLINMPADFLWQLINGMISYFIQLLTIASRYQLLFNIAEYSRFDAILAILASALLLLPFTLREKSLAAFLLLPLFIGRAEPIKQGSMSISVLDIGQGLSVLVETPKHVLLYDVGSSWGDRSMVTQVIWPLLQSKGIANIDRLVISHNDNDHAGGLVHLQNLIDISQIHSGQILQHSNHIASSCHQQEPWQWDGVAFSFISIPDRAKNNSNNSSCVLSVTSHGYRILIPGDIESSVEKIVADRERTSLKSDLLIAPHHGSISSSSWPFLRQVEPELVIFTTAYGNRFNHPHPQVTARYSALNIAQINTAHTGAITINIKNGSATKISHERQKKRYFWQH